MGTSVAALAFHGLVHQQALVEAQCDELVAEVVVLEVVPNPVAFDPTQAAVGAEEFV